VDSVFNISLPEIPNYRFAYFYRNHGKQRSDHTELAKALPGFRVETGMACSLGSLFDLSPRSSQFEPELFTSILPALRDEAALTIALYVRTGASDGKSASELKAWEDASTVSCALSLEQQYLKEKAHAGLPYSQVLWMAVTDSQGVKQWITKNYSGQYVYYNKSEGEGEVSSQVVKREVLVTSSRGAHTKSVHRPSSEDFADAMIDWYLIGESDLVVGYGPSFGATGALRTARPYFNLSKKCLVPLLNGY